MQDRDDDAGFVVDHLDPGLSQADSIGRWRRSIRLRRELLSDPSWPEDATRPEPVCRRHLMWGGECNLHGGDKVLMDRAVAGDYPGVAQAEAVTPMVRDLATGLGHQQDPGGRVPGLQPELPIALVPAGRDPAEVEGRAAEPADPLHPRQDLAQVGGVGDSVGVAVVGESGGDQAVRQRRLPRIPKSGCCRRMLHPLRWRSTPRLASHLSRPPPPEPPSFQRATDTETWGMPWMKLTVPSRGSTSHTRPVSQACPPLSSARIASSGKWWRITLST